MKAFLLLVVLALAGVYWFYLKDNPPSWMPGLGGSSTAKADASPAPVAKKDFKDVSKLLQGDMDRIPINLRGDRQMPTHAFDIKARVAPHLQTHEEYQTLTLVCDTIISADQDFDLRRSRCGIGQSTSAIAPQDRARAAAAAETLFQQQEAIWEGRRRQADSEVRLKLASLENHRL